VAEADLVDWTSAQAHRWQQLADELRRRLGSGVALDPATRRAFEGRLGTNLSGALVHRSRFAGDVARAVGADALTVDQHILGSTDQLDTALPSGVALLGHELTHVVQRTIEDDGEDAAQAVEQAVAREASQPGQVAARVDAEALAERVYRRLVDELRADRERAAWAHGA
jgi:hypothetical protein